MKVFTGGLLLVVVVVVMVCRDTVLFCCRCLSFLDSECCALLTFIFKVYISAYLQILMFVCSFHCVIVVILFIFIVT